MTLNRTCTHTFHKTVLFKFYFISFAGKTFDLNINYTSSFKQITSWTCLLPTYYGHTASITRQLCVIIRCWTICYEIWGRFSQFFASRTREEIKTICNSRKCLQDKFTFFVKENTRSDQHRHKKEYFVLFLQLGLLGVLVAYLPTYSVLYTGWKKYT